MLTFLRTFTWERFQARMHHVQQLKYWYHANSGQLRTTLPHSEFHQSKAGLLSKLFFCIQSFSFGQITPLDGAFNFVVIFFELLKFILESLKLLLPFDRLLQILKDLFSLFFNSMIRFICLVTSLVNYEYLPLTLLDLINFNEIEEFSNECLHCFIWSIISTQEFIEY